MLFILMAVLIVFPVEAMLNTKKFSKDSLKKYSKFVTAGSTQGYYNLPKYKSPFDGRYVQSREFSNVKTSPIKKNPHLHLGKSKVVNSSKILNKPTSSFAREYFTYAKNNARDENQKMFPNKIRQYSTGFESQLSDVIDKKARYGNWDSFIQQDFLYKEDDKSDRYTLFVKYPADALIENMKSQAGNLYRTIKEYEEFMDGRNNGKLKNVMLDIYNSKRNEESYKGWSAEQDKLFNNLRDGIRSYTRFKYGAENENLVRIAEGDYKKSKFWIDQLYETLKKTVRSAEFMVK